jgi:small subunit ribosomal protein S14
LFDIGFLSAKIASAFSAFFVIDMAKTSTKARALKPPKFKSRVVNRCFRCGRKRGYMRDFSLCRICFREYANEGMIPGIKKSSW